MVPLFFLLLLFFTLLSYLIIGKVDIIPIYLLFNVLLLFFFEYVQVEQLLHKSKYFRCEGYESESNKGRESEKEFKGRTYLQLLIGEIDAKLFKSIFLEALKSIDILFIT